MWPFEKPATIDWETFSAAGAVYDEEAGKWRALPGAGTKKSISAVGAAAYAEHPSTDILTLSYRLPWWAHGVVKRWRPGLPLPQDLFDWIAAGGLVEAHNVMFERLVWWHVAMRLYGFPALPPKQLRCSMAKARVLSLPGALGDLTKVINTKIQKDADGKRLLTKFSQPRNPTKKDPRLRITPADDPEDGEKLYSYCDTDVLSEEEASHSMMPMSFAELEFWQLDQEMNWRGIGVDIAGVNDMIAILEQALAKYGQECLLLTGGLEPSQVQKLQGWLSAKGVFMDSLDAEALEEALSRPNLPDDARRVLEIRGLVGSASVKKLYAMQRTASADGRVRNVIIHHGARTGRPTGDLLQPLNLPKAGPDLTWCDACVCPSKPGPVCPWCGGIKSPKAKVYKWPEVPKEIEGQLPIDWVMPIMATRSLDEVERYFGDALLTISGCIRGMIVADPGNELIASDYSAIEAVVTAMLSGCQWRIEAFREGKDIYLASAAKIKHTTYEAYLEYKREHGGHHPDRQKVGKPAELGLGFGGWLTAWRQFDSTDTFTDDEVKKNIIDWRAASPEIVEMWGGQERGRPGRAGYRLERYGFEGAFINAVQYPDRQFESHGIRFFMRGDACIIKLLSGRELTYHQPRLWPSTRDYVGEGVLEITYMTWNSNPKYGPMGWNAMKTYAGRLAENIVQATAHDIQRFGILALEAAGYPVVLHVYDEDVAEVPMGWGSIEELETIMARMPPWALGWPIRASGGWRGRRYRKA